MLFTIFAICFSAVGLVLVVSGLYILITRFRRHAE
jgi:hypothetical protein